MCLSSKVNLSIITNDIPKRSFLAGQEVDGRGGDLNVWGYSHTRSMRADLPSYNECFLRYQASWSSEKPKQASTSLMRASCITLPLFCFLFFFSLTSHLLNPAFTPDLHPHTVLLQTLQVQGTKTHLKLTYRNKNNVLVHLTGNVRVHLASIMIGSRGLMMSSGSFSISQLCFSLDGDLILSHNGQAFYMK